MTWPRCSGLLVPETVHDGALSEDLLRCVNCGRIGEAMAKPRETSGQTIETRRCDRCKKVDAISGQVLCEACRTRWRLYMNNRLLRVKVQRRGFKVVLAELNAEMLKIETKRNLLLKNRKAWGG